MKFWDQQLYLDRMSSSSKIDCDLRIYIFWNLRSKLSIFGFCFKISRFFFLQVFDFCDPRFDFDLMRFYLIFVFLSIQSAQKCDCFDFWKSLKRFEKNILSSRCVYGTLSSITCACLNSNVRNATSDFKKYCSNSSHSYTLNNNAHPQNLIIRTQQQRIWKFNTRYYMCV